MERSTSWRKSSHSGSGNACIEIRNDLQAVRDSKDPGGELPLLGDVRRLVHTVKEGS